MRPREEKKKNEMEILGTTFIVIRTICFLQIGILLDNRKLVGKIFNLSYFLLLYEIQDKEKNQLIFSTSKYQIGEILLSPEWWG